MLTLSIAFVAAFLSTFFIVSSGKVHSHRSGDHDFDKPQGFHVVPVPRIGGLAIVLGLLASMGAMWISDYREIARVGALLLACSAPAFLAGFVQDFTEAVTPRGRLAATAASALFAYSVLGTAIRVTDIPGLDWLVSFWAGAVIATVFAVTGVANSINIIDGFNGLASMCSMLMMAATAFVAFKVGDTLVGMLALAGIGAVFGFFFWNFPSGRIFLGDGGSYFLGFYLAEICLLMQIRNPEVSPLFPLLVCIYPVFETLFSIYRRVALRKSPAHMPDGIHLHSLIYRRLMRFASVTRSAEVLTERNSMTAPYLWFLCMGSVVPAVFCWDSTPAITSFLMVFGLAYSWLYRRIVRFRTPKWLVVRR